MNALLSRSRGRVGGLTLKLSKLTRLLAGLNGAEDFIPFVTARLNELDEGKADKTYIEALENRLLEAGVGGGESMGNSLLQMETTIEGLTEKVAVLVVEKPGLAEVQAETGKAEDRIKVEIEKQAAELVRVYKSTTERLDVVDETKAERDWIQDLIDKIKRQVGGLKKKMEQGPASDGEVRRRLP